MYLHLGIIHNIVFACDWGIEKPHSEKAVCKQWYNVIIFLNTKVDGENGWEICPV